VPVCEQLRQEKTIEVGGQPFDISRRNFDLRIVLPRLLARAGIQGQTEYVERCGLGPVSVKTPTRSYPFFVHAQPKDGRLQLCDYPTTLRASQEVIELALGDGALQAGSKRQRLLEAKEIENFHKALGILLQRPEAVHFADHVHIEYDE
jgi:hypothetical protein